MTDEPHYQLFEPINHLDIRWLLDQETLHNNPEEDSKVRIVLESLLKCLKLNKCIKISYKTSKNMNGYGRFIPYHNATKVRQTHGGLATLNRAVRGFLADFFGVDIDIRKCHWNIIKYLLNKHEIDTKKYDKFIDNYSDISQWIIDQKIYIVDPNNKCSNDTPLELAKKTLFSILNTEPSIASSNAARRISAPSVFSLRL